MDLAVKCYGGAVKVMTDTYLQKWRCGFLDED